MIFNVFTCKNIAKLTNKNNMLHSYMVHHITNKYINRKIKTSVYKII